MYGQGLFVKTPSDTDTRFRFKRNANRTASSMWGPRNGEKPKNTPSANAAVVRSGASSMCGGG